MLNLKLVTTFIIQRLGVDYNMDINFASQYILIEEPELLFSATTREYCHQSPIDGLKNWGPYDSSIPGVLRPNNPIRLAIISVPKKVKRLLTYLNSLNKNIKLPKTDEYLRDYKGFRSIYQTNLLIPEYGSNLIHLITEEEINQCLSKEDKELYFLELVKKCLRELLLHRNEFDLIIFHITDEMLPFERVYKENYTFDLHDHVKAFSAPNNLKIQLLRDKSIPISNVDHVRKAWWLSLAIYSKAGGIPFKLAEPIPKTAYVGLSYAIAASRGKNKIVLGVSQVFDETGEGIRFRLFPVENPLWEKFDVHKKNPFMSAEDARRLFTTIRQDYQSINGELPVRIVVHKTTQFRQAEINGICEAMTGINEIELLTVQKNTPHRLILGGDDQKDNKGNWKREPALFPVRRGTVLPLDKESFLLSTQGDVLGIHPKGLHYYQEKRGIPSPLLIQRFLGVSPIETVAKDILKLTKMNWNNLQIYNRLPVTVIFAHRIAEIVKQLETYRNIPSDFRYYI
jgi:hypothetical protein